MKRTPGDGLPYDFARERVDAMNAYRVNERDDWPSNGDLMQEQVERERAARKRRGKEGAT